MSVHETKHARGDRIEPHRHDLGYAALVLDGAYEELSADGVWRVEAGDLIVHPAFHLHLNRFEVGGARVFNVALSHATLRALNVNRYLVVRVDDPDRLANKVGCGAADAVGEALEGATALDASPPRDWLDRFAGALSGAPQHRVGELAHAHGVTPEHASRAFTRRFGMTPARMRSEHRLQAALRSLAEGVYSLAQIAIEAGYADQAHFTRAVAAATGLPPAKLQAALG